MSSPTSPAQRAAVLTAILNDASEDDLTAYGSAIQERRAILTRLAAAAVTTGVAVRIVNIKPRYLDGLTGTVTEVVPPARRNATKCVTVMLDEASTETYKAHRAPYGSQEKQATVTGIPITCCRPVDMGESL
ncbi:hypothetical protein [Streptosporangium sandarakinum]|uniref:hypothetical protein n=1 Tax=Streptosporangium sandarakinum TaxID=1260955 RepID=UPI003683AA67